MTNGPELFDDTYIRYLTKTIRDAFPFREVAIKVVLRDRKETTPGGGGKGEPDEIDLAMLPLPVAGESMELPTPVSEPIIDGEFDADEMGDVTLEPPAPKVVAVKKPKAARPAKKPKKPPTGTWDF